MVQIHIIQKNKFQTQPGNLDATNAHPQLHTSTRPWKLCMIQLRISLTSKPHAPGKRGTLAWITGSSVMQDFVLFIPNLFCSIIVHLLPYTVS